MPELCVHCGSTSDLSRQKISRGESQIAKNFLVLALGMISTVLFGYFFARSGGKETRWELQVPVCKKCHNKEFEILGFDNDKMNMQLVVHKSFAERYLHQNQQKIEELEVWS